MKFTKHLPVFTFACALGFAPVAFAQTSTGGTMAPMPNSTMAPAAQAPAMAAPAAPAAKPAAPAMKPAELAKSSEFKTQAEATAHCPSDTVVWSTLSKSKTYHTSTSKYFGKTKHGAYVCKADVDAAGYHQAKN